MSELRFTTDQIRALLLRANAHPREVGERLRWLLRYSEHGSVSDTCREFNIARSTFYRWARRFDPANLSTLEDTPTLPPIAARFASPVATPVAPVTSIAPVAKTGEGACLHRGHLCLGCTLHALLSLPRRRPVLLMALCGNVALFLMLTYMISMEARLRRLQEDRLSPASAFSAAVVFPDATK